MLDLEPMSCLFQKVYAKAEIPEQWKISKIIPTFKKRSKNNIEYHRPIDKFCSNSKIFKKLILKQIQYLGGKNKLDLTGKQQHRFKRNKSMATAGALFNHCNILGAVPGMSKVYCLILNLIIGLIFKITM